MNGEVCNDLYWTVNDKSIASISTSTPYSNVNSFAARTVVTEDDFLGTWSGPSDTWFTFLAGGSGKCNLSAAGVSATTFTWSLSNNAVIITVAGSQIQGTVSGNAMTTNIGKFTKNGTGGSGGGGGTGGGGSAMIEGDFCIVSGNRAGTVKITAQTKDYRYSATCSVKVTDIGIAATGLAIDKNSAEVESGKKVFLRPKFTPANATDQSVTWTSSDPTIATVDQYGIVTGVATRSDTVTITAKSSTYTASCNVKVKGGILDSTSVDQVFSGEWQYSSSITIPRYITNIDVSFFQSNMPSLQEIRVENGNENFVAAGGVLFNKDKTKLIWYPRSKNGKNYTIPTTVTTIGGSAFTFCSSLASITIPSSVTSIGQNAFTVCSELESVTVYAFVPPSLGNNAFSNNAPLFKIYVSKDVLNDYTANEYWSKYAYAIVAIQEN